MQDKDIDRVELASIVRREFLKGASWLTGAVVLGAGGAVLTACSKKSEEVVADPNKIEGFQGTTFWKDKDGYELARRGSVWVGNKPNRFPAIIVYPKDENDVIAAIKFANEHKLKVGPRSGGHSWTAPHMQDGAMLINLASWYQTEIDAANKTAWIQPSVKSGALMTELNKMGLMFPCAHHPDVSLGGFLMCGGFGRNSGVWGIGTENILEIECITAKGEKIRANETENPDYYWAVRGGGPNFFGVVTRMKLRIYDTPKVMRQVIHVYDIKDYDPVMRWTVDITPKLPEFVEALVSRRRYDAKTGGWGPDTFSVIAVAFSDSLEEAQKGLAMLETCPAFKRVVRTVLIEDATPEKFYEIAVANEPDGWRFAVDGMWTNAPADELVPALRDLFETPTPRSYIYYALWGGARKLPDMALSLQARTYVAAHTRWEKPEDDEKMFAWTNGQMKRLEPLSIGSKVNDDSSVHRKSRYFSEAAEARLKELRIKYDPEGRFLGFLKVGDPV